VKTIVHSSPALARHSNGLVLLGVLLLLALAAVAALVGAEVWATAAQREREEQLLFVGDQYRRAIESYWRATPGRVRSLPNSLEVLLEDDRFPMPVRHLRRLYRDPLEAQAEWGLVKIDSGIAGVYSNSDSMPLKRRGFPARYADFEDARDYKQWRFVFQAPGQAVRPAPPRPSKREAGQ
jgi:type II secretory pathway pseudopilin PulG